MTLRTTRRSVAGTGKRPASKFATRPAGDTSEIPMIDQIRRFGYEDVMN